MTQGARDRAMKGFRDCRFDVLVATDIVARGIDVEQVSHVINYDVPDTADAYTHRIGRTGRSEREGRAYTFVAEDDLLAIEDMERKLGITIERCTIDGFEGMQIPLPTRRQRQTARKSSSRSHSRGQRNSSSAPRRHDNRKSSGSNFESRRSHKPRHDNRKSDDSNFDSRKSRKPRHDSARSTDPGSTSHRSAGARARARDAEELPFKFKWMEDLETGSTSNETSPPRRKRAAHGPSGEDTPAKKSKSRGKRRRRRNRHRHSNADTSN